MTLIPDLERDLDAAARRVRGRRLQLGLKRVAAAGAVATAIGLLGFVGLDRGDEPQRQTGAGSVDPSSVTVAVLNATRTPGLAATTGDDLLAAGFKVGYISNAPGGKRAESVIFFARGHRPAAAAVGQLLDIARLKRVSPKSKVLFEPAHVTVVAGSDRLPRHS
jgi:hypothetical protein